MTLVHGNKAGLSKIRIVYSFKIKIFSWDKYSAQSAYTVLGDMTLQV